MRYKFSFERLRVWEDAMVLVKMVYELTAVFPKEELYLYGLTNQLRRAAVSVPSNLAEGHSKKSSKEQMRYIEIAFGSLMEAQCQIQIAQRLQYVSEDATTPIMESIAAIARQLNALRNSQANKTEEPEVPYTPSPNSPIPLSPSNPFIHPTALADPGATIGSGTKIWHFCHVMAGAVIGENCSLGQNVFVANGVVLGNNVKVQNNVSIYEGVICEEDVFLGPSMVFTNVMNPRSAVNRKSEYQQTLVGRGATIGANATIVCGLHIGAYAFIGAGAVVTKTIPPYALVVGNPARQIGWMSEHGERLHFDEKNEATCPGSGEQYCLADGVVVKVIHQPK
ncbi:MAG TPA: four helix bundle protein [Saprospiraceae bacterium]|mgnify:CR=1 FL=1|nr:four helix bundle protein [Saprospiraceae bacterium]HMP23644.1 four helix bundle protein [Saprospiraceae bacterium]